MSRRWLALPALVALIACSAAPLPDARPATVIVPVAASCAAGVAGCDEAAPPSLPAVTSSPCINGAVGLRCDGLIGPREAKELPDAIRAAREAVMRSAFADVPALVRLARLHLRSDGDDADVDGHDGVARGVRFAMSAVAVDDASVPAHVVLTLALARSLQKTRASADPAVRDLALGLGEIALQTVPVAQGGSVGAVARTLEGYLAIERGQAALAESSFEAATKLDPNLGTAWVGLGDAARSASDFAAATVAYENAAARLPDDAGVSRALQAAARKEALTLPAAPASPRPVIASGPLAPAPPAPPRCTAAQAGAAAPSATLCRGLARVAGAGSPADREEAARLIIEGWTSMRPLCEKRDKACGPLVTEALAAASRAFQAAGRPAKSIAVGKLILDHERTSGAAAVGPAIMLELGDRYFALGIFAEAAAWYAKHVKSTRGGAGAVAERALMLHAALGNAGEATALADELARNASHAADRRAAWLLTAAAVVRDVQGHEAAASWLKTHQALLDQAGAAPAAAAVSSPLPAPAPGVVCAAPLSCAVRRLAGETW